MIDEIPKVEWEDFLENHFQWKQGQHVTAIGPTGQGKTTLIKAILPQRKYVVTFVTKKKDSLISEFLRDGYKKVKEWGNLPHSAHPKILLHPPFLKTEPREAEQRRQFKHALNRVFDETGWTVYLDEAPYIVEDLGLLRQVKRLWQQGRSLKVTVIASAQRPRFLPLAAYSQATHLFFWRNSDENDSKRLGGLGGLDRKLIQRVVASLAEHEVLYVNTRTGALVITKVRK
jgi:energy-coupling factor transporter ATP-binding protein EcfA2